MSKPATATNNIYEDEQPTAAAAAAAAAGTNQQKQQGEQVQHEQEQERQDKSFEKLRMSFHKRNYFWMLLLGLLNNYFYCVVLAGAQAVAESFHLKSLMALQSWALIMFGVVVRSINAFVLFHWAYNKKYFVAGLLTLTGMVICCVAPLLGDSDGFRFFMFLIGVIGIGSGSSFGEQTSLAYCNLFPATTIGGWSSGTGFSGVVAALIYLGLSNANLTEPQIYAIQLPFVFVYFFCYYWGIILVPKDEVRFVELLDGNSQEEDAVETKFTAITNWERSWADLDIYSSSSSNKKNSTTQSGASSSSSSGNTLSSGSSKSSIELGADKTFTQEKAPLLLVSPASAINDGTPSNNAHHSVFDDEDEQDEDDDPDLLDEEKDEARKNFSDQEEEAEEEGESERSSSKKQEEDEKKKKKKEESRIERRKQRRQELELSQEQTENQWGAFRKCLFRVSPVFPAEAISSTTKVVIWQAVNLFLVYIFEYCVQFIAPALYPDFDKKDNNDHTNNNTSSNLTTTTTMMIPATTLTDFSTTTTTASPSSSSGCPPKSAFGFVSRNGYVLSQLAYQVGVLISRSSLPFFTVKRFEIPTLLQLINLTIALIFGKTKWLVDRCDPSKQEAYSWIVTIFFIWVGLMGGLSYISCFYAILSDESIRVKLDKISREEYGRQKRRQKRFRELKSSSSSSSSGAGNGSGENSINNNNNNSNNVAENDDDDGEIARMNPMKLNSKELAMNVSALWQTMGIFFGALMALILDNVMFDK